MVVSRSFKLPHVPRDQFSAKFGFPLFATQEISACRYSPVSGPLKRNVATV